MKNKLSNKMKNNFYILQMEQYRIWIEIIISNKINPNKNLLKFSFNYYINHQKIKSLNKTYYNYKNINSNY